jgi:hypothetical protein
VPTHPLPEYLKLSDLAKLLPGRPSTICLWRWCRHGLTTRTGVKVRLAHIRVGRNLMSTREDCDAFFQAVADSDVAHFDVRDVQRPAKLASRPKDVQAAHDRLAAAGM